ncbi:hypothetical protein MMC10_008061 [Thelotrema lepadinum]|nr:hypothetical protein [Thelotrema lepadinum]
MTSGSLPRDPRIANWEAVAIRADQNALTPNQKTGAATANMESYPRAWYVEKVGRGPKRPDLNMPVLWEGIGADQDAELKSAMKQKANALVGDDILHLNLKDKKQHQEIEDAIKLMDRAYKTEVLRKRSNCTLVFRECLWHKLILSCRKSRRKVCREDSDDTYVEEDLDTEAPSHPALGLPNRSSKERNRKSTIKHNSSQLVNKDPQVARDIGRGPFQSGTPERLEDGISRQPLEDVCGNPTEKGNTIDSLSEATTGGSLAARPKGSTPRKDSYDKTTPPGLPSPKSDGSRAAIRRGPSLLGAIGSKNDLASPLKRQFPGNAGPKSAKKRKKTIPNNKSTFTNNNASSVPNDCNPIELDSDSDLPGIEPVLRALRDLDDLPLVTRPKTPKSAESPPKNSKEKTSENPSKPSPGSAAQEHTSADASRTGPADDPPKQNEEATDSTWTRPAHGCGASPSTISPERQDRTESPATPRSRTISSSSPQRIIPGFKLINREPHGQVRVGYVREGEYFPIHTGKITTREIEDILQTFRNSTNTFLTGMQMWLRDTCYIDGLGIQSVTLPPTAPYPELYAFVEQAALRERSKVGLDFVVEPVGLEDYFE